MSEKNVIGTTTESMSSVEPNPSYEEMDKFAQELKKASLLRVELIEKIRLNSDPELVNLLTELNEAIDAGRRKLSTFSAGNLRSQFKIIREELTEIISQADEEELLTLGEESEPERHLRDYLEVRASTIDAIANLYPEDHPEELTESFERMLSDLRRLLDDKISAAEKRFPHLKKPAKEYEMDEGYHKALGHLLEAIEQRDTLAELLKEAPPERRAEGLQLLSLLDQKIEEGEQALADEYEAAQNHARAEDDLRQTLKHKTQAEMAQIRAYCQASPGKMSAVEKILAKEFPEPKGH